MKRVMNVGGGRFRDLPPLYRGWTQVLLDIDPEVTPDVCCDAKLMKTLKAKQYEAIFCSHNLEHFYQHDVPVVLGGFHHVLKPNGFVQIVVPDMRVLMEVVVKEGRDLTETWYVSSGGPVTFHDVLYGWGRAMRDGNLYYAHKCGFTERSLTKALHQAKFPHVFTSSRQANLEAYAFKLPPTKAQRLEIGL